MLVLSSFAGQAEDAGLQMPPLSLLIQLILVVPTVLKAAFARPLKLVQGITAF